MTAKEKLQLIEEIAGNELETGSGAGSEHFLTVLHTICTIIHFQPEGGEEHD